MIIGMHSSNINHRTRLLCAKCTIVPEVSRILSFKNSRLIILEHVVVIKIQASTLDPSTALLPMLSMWLLGAIYDTIYVNIITWSILARWTA